MAHLKKENDAHEVAPSEHTKKKPILHAGHIGIFGISFVTWLILSGRFDVFHITLGIISCGIVTAISGDLSPYDTKLKSLRIMPMHWFRFLGYLPWLMREILSANLHLAYLVFHPKMKSLIDPNIIRVESRLRGDIPLFAFANSITLTPGTITVYVSVDGVLSVHVIDKQSGDALPGEMERRIERIFAEKPGRIR